jgi:hypothetical protein
MSRTLRRHDTIALLCLLALPFVARAQASLPRFAPTTVSVFSEEMIHFSPSDSTAFASHGVTVADMGRVIVRRLRLPEPPGPCRIFARVATIPIPKDELQVHDPWDRAGNVRLVLPGMADVEIVKFITAYGGFSEHEVEVTQLAPLLRGECVIKGFVDTWSSPGWKMDFSLRYESAPGTAPPDWALGLLYTESVRSDTPPESLRGAVEVPAGLSRIELQYLVSGHCTDGRDADEFVSKPNVIRIDGRELVRFKPWRDDCLQFRARNPYCRRWSDGNWSSDYSRSGWCPSDAVAPLVFDATRELGSGEHEIAFAIESIRPRGSDGQFGYWRVSARLVGWRD